MNSEPRLPLLRIWYDAYLRTGELQSFIDRVACRYSAETLARFTTHADRLCRRAAVLAIGRLGTYADNAIIGAALSDNDRGVRMLADAAIQNLWREAADPEERRRLDKVMRLNDASRHHEAIEAATRLVDRAPELAEAWNQRAIAWYLLDRYHESIHDCRRAVELNPWHFGAAAGMGQCYLQLGDRAAALNCFRKAIAINPDLEGVRANIIRLERALKPRR